MKQKSLNFLINSLKSIRYSVNLSPLSKHLLFREPFSRTSKQHSSSDNNHQVRSVAFVIWNVGDTRRKQTKQNKCGDTRLALILASVCRIIRRISLTSCSQRQNKNTIFFLRKPRWFYSGILSRPDARTSMKVGEKLHVLRIYQTFPLRNH